jgi:hypothetical protein
MRRAGGSSAEKKVVAAAPLKLATSSSGSRAMSIAEGDRFSNAGIMSPSSSWAAECRLRR